MQDFTLDTREAPPLPANLRTLRAEEVDRLRSFAMTNLAQDGPWTAAEPGPSLHVCAHHISLGQSLPADVDDGFQFIPAVRNSAKALSAPDPAHDSLILCRDQRSSHLRTL